MAEKTIADYKAELAQVKEQCKQEKLKFILSQSNVSDACIAKQVKELNNQPKFCVDFMTGGEDDLCRFNLIDNGAVEYDDFGVKFDGTNSITIDPVVEIKGKNFSIETEVRVGDVEDSHWFIGDTGLNPENSFHMGWRNPNLFSVDFFGDGMNVKQQQLKDEVLKIKFKFNAKSKVGILDINGKEHRHVFKSPYMDTITFIGQGAKEKGSFKGSIKNLCIWVD